MEITELHKGEEEAWDSYIYELDMSTSHHQIGWKNVVEKTYGHKPRYLVARADDGRLIGVLPMFMRGCRVFDRKLVLVPFAPYGRMRADDAGVERARLWKRGEREEIIYRWVYCCTDGRRKGQAHNDSRIIRRFWVYR